MNAKTVFGSFGLSLLLLGPTASYGDDTDIYVGSNEEINSEPLVMLTLDLRPSLGASFCDFATTCSERLGPEIYPTLVAHNTQFNLNLASNGVTVFDAMRAVYGTLFAELDNVKVGLMVGHKDTVNDGNGGNDGGYVLQGFRSFQISGDGTDTDPNGAKEQLLTKMYSIPAPQSGGGGGGGGGGGVSPGGVSCTADPVSDSMYVNGVAYSLSRVVVDEGNTATFAITGTGTASARTRFTITTADGWMSQPAASSRGGGKDYDAQNTNAQVNLDSVNPAFSVDVPTVADNLVDAAGGKEYFTLVVSAGGESMSVPGVICDVSSREISVFSPGAVNEGVSVDFTVALSSPSPDPVTVNYTTQDAGSAIAGSDYTLTSGTLTIPAGDVSAIVSVPTIDDGVDEGAETFNLVLSNPSAGITDGTMTAVGTILDAADCAPSSGNYAHQHQGAELYFELYRYLTGGDVEFGFGDGRGRFDYTGPTDTNLDTECYQPGENLGLPNTLKWDRGAGTDEYPYVHDNMGSYESPLTDGQQCVGTYAVNLMFGVAQKDGGAENLIDVDDNFETKPTANQDPFAYMIGWMTNEDFDGDKYRNINGGATIDGRQNVTSYLLNLSGAAGGQFNAYEAAGGIVYDVDSENMQLLLDQLREVFRQILSVSTTFVSASVPVDVFNRAAVNDNVFIALFTANSQPYWYGNLKKLKLLELTSGGFRLIDAQDSTPDDATPSAVATDGRIRYDALTYWTESGALPAAGSTYDIDAADEQQFKVTGRDGRFVPRGAAGHKIPGFFSKSPTSSTPDNPGRNRNDELGYPRKLFTTDASGDNKIWLDIDNISDNQLADLTVAFSPDPNNPRDPNDPALMEYTQSLICYVRGISNCDSIFPGNGIPVAGRPARPAGWIMGDSLHSRPLPINYGDRDGPNGGIWSEDNPDIRVVLGSNDGYFRMVQNTAGTSGNELGVENWAFMPRELLGIQEKLKFNSSRTPHPYGVDGEPVVLVDSRYGASPDSVDHSNDRVWIYFGLRRGGKGVYAIDASDPDLPTVKWTINGQTPGFEELGLTFSTPSIGVVDFDGTPREVVMFGAGYYGDSDKVGQTTGRSGYDVYNNAANLTDSNGDPYVEGNAVYIVDADTGDLIWKATGSTADPNSPVCPDGYCRNYQANMVHAVAAEVTLTDTNGDYVDDRAYVADVGGNIWRIDLPRNPDPNNFGDHREAWQIAKIAELGNGAGAGSGGRAADQRFFHRVDYVPTQYPGSTTAFDALLIGSGDRAHPKDTDAENDFYMIVDRNGNSRPNPNGTPVTRDQLADANCFLGLSSDNPNPGDCQNANSQLAYGWRIAMEAEGEKVLAPSITVANQVFFTSYLPEGELNAQGETDVCVGKEGTGRFYAVSLFNGYPILNQNGTDDGGKLDPSSKADRFSPLASKGIPSELVPLGPGYFIKPDLSIGQTSGSSIFRTFWYEKGVD